MTFTDTHCHIHEASYLHQEEAVARAEEAGIERLICVGTDEHTSEEAVAFAATHRNSWASVGLHPHDAVSGTAAIARLRRLLEADDGTIVAIGECGLDYFYDNSPRGQQEEMLRAQLKLAREFDKPVIFHVREAFDDFWPIFDEHEGIRGVLHSFTDNERNLRAAVERGLYVGVNGISTFARAEGQQAMYRHIPLDHLLLETDAPFLTPIPHRGKVNEPAFITHIAHHIANLQSISLEELSRATERNATNLFLLNK